MTHSYEDVVGNYRDLWCRRCGVYDCKFHGMMQPRPRDLYVVVFHCHAAVLSHTHSHTHTQPHTATHSLSQTHAAARTLRPWYGRRTVVLG